MSDKNISGQGYLYGASPFAANPFYEKDSSSGAATVSVTDVAITETDGDYTLSQTKNGETTEIGKIETGNLIAEIADTVTENAENGFDKHELRETENNGTVNSVSTFYLAAKQPISPVSITDADDTQSVILSTNYVDQTGTIYTNYSPSASMFNIHANMTVDEDTLGADQISIQLDNIYTCRVHLIGDPEDSTIPTYHYAGTGQDGEIITCRVNPEDIYINVIVPLFGYSLLTSKSTITAIKKLQPDITANYSLTTSLLTVGNAAMLIPTLFTTHIVDRFSSTARLNFFTGPSDEEVFTPGIWECSVTSNFNLNNTIYGQIEGAIVNNTFTLYVAKSKATGTYTDTYTYSGITECFSDTHGMAIALPYSVQYNVAYTQTAGVANLTEHLIIFVPVGTETTSNIRRFTPTVKYTNISIGE